MSFTNDKDSWWYIRDKGVIEMSNEERENREASSSVDNARRKLLKIGVYAAPAVLMLGKVAGARASGNPIPKRKKIKKIVRTKKIIRRIKLKKRLGRDRD